MVPRDPKSVSRLYPSLLLQVFSFFCSYPFFPFFFHYTACTCEANSDPIVCFFSDRCLGFRCPPENPEPLPPDFIPLPQIPPRLHGQVCSDPTAVRMLGTDCRYVPIVAVATTNKKEKKG